MQKQTIKLNIKNTIRELPIADELSKKSGSLHSKHLSSADNGTVKHEYQTQQRQDKMYAKRQYRPANWFAF